MTSDDVLPVAPDAPPVYFDAATVFALRGFVIVVLRRLGVARRDVHDLCMIVLETAYFASRAGAYMPHPERDPNEALRAYLVGFAWRIARRHLAKCSTRNEIPAGLTPGEDIGIDPRAQIEARDAVAVLRHLPRADREMLLERADGDTYSAIGERRSFSLRTAWRRIDDARSLVRAIIDKGDQ